MEKIGVEAVVTGLASFLSNMDKVDNSIKKLGPAGTLLSKTFDAVKGAVTSFGQSVLHVAEYALGQLLADAIKGVISLLGELASGVLESADTFQKLEIRLQRLNFNDAKNSGMEYNEAMEQAIRLTKEQIDWTIKLGATTPYDAKDIANIYTMGRGYGFTADESRMLTDAVIQFTAGMGLSRVEMERIIVNFGQLSQQGKLNGQDIRDLARGAYVPVNRVLEMTAQKLGMTREEFDKLRQTGKLSAEAVDVFRESFVELVGVDFEGAAQALGDVFSVAIDNIKGLVQDMLGLKIVKPILLEIGKYLQNVTDALAGNDEMWKRFQDAVSGIGTTIVEIVTGWLGLAPSAESVAEAVTVAMEKISAWFADNKENIIGFVQGLAEKIGEFIGKVVDVWNKLSAWVTENRPIIEDFFKSLGEIVGDVFEGLFGGGEIDFSLEGVLESLKQFMAWVVLNKEQIAEWIEKIIKLGAAFLAFSAIVETLIAIFFVVVKVVTSVILVIMSLALIVAAFTTSFAVALGAVVAGLAVALGAFAAFTAGFLAGFLGLGQGVVNWAASTVATIKYWITETSKKFADWKNSVVQSISNWASETTSRFLSWVSEIKNINWLSIGISIVQGIKNGVLSMGSSLVNSVVQVGINAYNALKNALGVKSPSKLFMKVGYSIDEGLISGILGMAKEVGSAMQVVMSEVAAPAMTSSAIGSRSVSNTYQYTTTNNLNVHTSARSEPIISDFNMMSALQGA